MKQTIVFDLDGTLITCENKQKYILFSILNSLGYSKPDSLLEDWWQLKRNAYNTESALIRMGIANAHLISNEWKRVVEDFPWNYFDAPFEDSLSTLEYLKDTGCYKVFILTARRSASQVFQSIQRFGFNNLVDDVIIVNPEKVIEEKTNYLKRVYPIFYIGDTELDYKAATNSDTKFIGLSRGQRCLAFLKKSGIPQIEHNLKFLYNIDKIS